MCPSQPGPVLSTAQGPRGPAGSHTPCGQGAPPHAGMPDIQGDAPGISCDSELRRCTTPRGAPSPRNTMLLGPHQGCLLFWVKVLSHRPLKCLPSHCLKSGGVCQHSAEPCPLRSWLPAPPGEVSDSRVSLGEKPSRRISPPRALHPIQRVAVLHSAMPRAH